MYIHVRRLKCVCVCVCVCACMCACLCACVFACLCARVCVRTCEVVSPNLTYAATCQLMHLLPRVFVEFHRPRPSRTRPVEAVQPVLDAVYVALKRRQSRQPLELYADARDRGRHSWRRSERVVVVEDELKPIKLPRTGFHQIIVTEVRWS